MGPRQSFDTSRVKSVQRAPALTAEAGRASAEDKVSVKARGRLITIEMGRSLGCDTRGTRQIDIHSS